MQESVSEVAQLRRAIEDECTALQRALTAPAMVASHNMIHHKYEALEQHKNKLALHIGEEQATNEMCDIYNRVVVDTTPN